MGTLVYLFEWLISGTLGTQKGTLEFYLSSQEELVLCEVHEHVRKG